jgi:hypothetical protein
MQLQQQPQQQGGGHAGHLTGTIASSPLELSALEASQLQLQQQGVRLAVESSTVEEELDLELQEAELMSEHPGDWNPLYTDDQLLDDQASPPPTGTIPIASTVAGVLSPAAAMAAAAAAAAGSAVQFGVGGLVPAAVAAAAEAAAAAAAAAAATAGGSNGGGVTSARSRRGSLLQARAMSVEPAGWNDELEEGVGNPGMITSSGAGIRSSDGGVMSSGPGGSLVLQQMLQDRPHVAAPEGGSGPGGQVVEQEMGVALDPNWSYQAPSHLEQGYLQLRQQQLMQQQALQMQMQMQQLAQQQQQQQQQQQGYQVAGAGQGSRSFDSGLALLQYSMQGGVVGQQQQVTAGNSADGWVGLQQQAVQQQAVQQQLQQQLQQQQQGGRRGSMMMLVDMEEEPQ